VEKKEDKIVKTEEEMEEEIRNRTESATDGISRKPIELDISDESRSVLKLSQIYFNFCT